MDRERMAKVLGVYGRPVITDKDGKPIAVFARQTLEDAEEIERTPTDQLVEQWKGTVWLNCIYGQVGLDDLQRIDLIELEFDARGKEIEPYELGKWLDAERAEHEKAEAADAVDRAAEEAEFANSASTTVTGTVEPPADADPEDLF